jgi:hypothetical protein
MSTPNTWTDPACLANIKLEGGTLCAANHCDTSIIVKYTHDYCFCQGAWKGPCGGSNPPPNCCPFNGSSPVPVISEDCYCCCSCLANDTPVAYAKDQFKAIMDFQANVDMVYVADDVSLKSWSQRRVMFSAGAGDAGAANVMIKVTYGEVNDQDFLLVNRTQLFLMADRKLKPAAALVPGKDSLVSADGTPRPVLGLETGVFNRGMHHIATTLGPAKSPDGHLILAKNIVCGDWALQVALASPTHSAALPTVDNLADHPEFGTPEYAQAHTHLEHAPHRAAVATLAAAAAPSMVPGLQSVHGTQQAYIPENAFAFLTRDQSWDIYNNAPIAPPATQAGKQVLQYLFKLFGAFYPDIQFFYDEFNVMPNAYHFTEYGGTRIVVTGGLARCQHVQINGMAFILATLVAATSGSPPLNDNGQSCHGIAAYSAASVLTQVWIGLHAVPVIKGGIEQLTTLFGCIGEGNRGGTDTCMNISTDCRIKSMQAAFQMLPLPHCAGGPPDAALVVSGVTGTTATTTSDHGSVTVTFNLPVDPETAQQIGNYGFDPHADTFSASVSPDTPSAVVIVADLTPATTYELTAMGVLTKDGEPLVADGTSGKFTTE